MNPFKERRNDAIQTTPKDPSNVLVGPVTRLRVKCLKEAFIRLLQDTQVKMDFNKILNNEI